MTLQRSNLTEQEPLSTRKDKGDGPGSTRMNKGAEEMAHDRGQNGTRYGPGNTEVEAVKSALKRRD